MTSLFSSPKTPKPPNYEAAARAQGEANLEAIRAGAALNRVNQSGPTGSTTYKNLGGDRWEQNTTLTPDQQAILDAQEGNQIDMGRIANQRLDQFGNSGELDFTGQPSRVTGVNTSNFKTNVSSPGTRYQDLDLNGLPGIPGADDFGAERQRVEEAMYGRAASSLDPQFKQREEAMRTRLLNSGNVEGSEAWNNEMGNFERERQGAYDQARNSAILAGGNEQSRMLADALNARGQTFDERLNQGQFGNQAANQDLQAELAKLGLHNAAESDRFAQDTTNASLTNSARDAGINEQMMLRNQPLQEFLQLFGGGSGTGVNAPNIPQAGTPQAPDLFGATQAGYQSQIDAYNAKQGANAQNMQGIGQLASILGMFSDRRLKREIKRVGELPNGLPIYRFKYISDDISRVGVMAQDVELFMPEAVAEIGGYKHVDYRAIGAEHLLEMH